MWTFSFLFHLLKIFLSINSKLEHEGALDSSNFPEFEVCIFIQNSALP